MKGPILAWGLALATTLAAGCRPQCPVCVECPACDQAEPAVVEAPPPPPEPVETPRGPCTEEWVHMPVLIGFPTGGAALDAQSRVILEQVVRTAQTRDDILQVRVEGHTDTCGNEQNNMDLSNQRAEAVEAALVEMGVPAEQIQTVGYGSTQPRANEACGRGRQSQQLSQATNRRVEFSILTCQETTAGGAAP
ncbi:MAG: OmpA family protein [Sandaracinaceae bacterium]